MQTVKQQAVLPALAAAGGAEAEDIPRVLKSAPDYAKAKAWVTLANSEFNQLVK